ncbi:MAG TPA: 50S ribosomal protein L29 [Bryobacteraceae bacterium]|jgi:large subunit ribosomal protein L29|nr:50S ribosomal protein L29 [Bryobacteraceae bacterium]
MRAEKIREIDTTELQRQAADAADQLFRLKFQMAMGQTDGLRKYRALKRDRARMLTILRQRELNPAEKPEPEKKGKKGKK